MRLWYGHNVLLQLASRQFSPLLTGQGDSDDTADTLSEEKHITLWIIITYPVISWSIVRVLTFSHPSSVLRCPLQVTARVISSLPLSLVRHFAGRNQSLQLNDIALNTETTENCVCVTVLISDLRGKQLSVLEPQPAGRRRATRTQRSPEAMAGSVPMAPPLPAEFGHEGEYYLTYLTYWWLQRFGTCKCFCVQFETLSVISL